MKDQEKGLSQEQIKTGTPLATLRKLPVQERINLYARSSGDHNPIHTDAEYAGKTPFGGTIAHGMLVLAYISEMMLISFGSSWLTTGWLSLRFRSPAHAGKPVIAEGSINSVENTGGQTKVTCRVACRDEEGNTIINGEAGLTVTPSPA